MQTTEKHRAWLLKVMSFDVGQAGAPASQAPTALRPIWQHAKEAADGQLTALAAELRSYDDDDFNQIAEYGLFGLTGGRQTVGLLAALTEYDGAAAGGRDKAAADVRAAVADYRAVLTGNPLVALVDDNPFGVHVGLRATLEWGLGHIEQAVD